MTFSIRQRPLLVLAIASVCGFLLILVAEHFANPGLDPATHHVSEYVHAHLGWLMTVGFALWALSLVLTAVIVSGVTPGGRALAAVLLVAALGMAVTACFATQTSAGQLPPGVSPSTAGRLHNLGSGATTLALLLAVPLSLRLRRPLLRRVAVTLIAIAVPATVLLLALGDDVAGIRQRLLIAIACGWQLTLLDSEGDQPRGG